MEITTLTHTHKDTDTFVHSSSVFAKNHLKPTRDEQKKVFPVVAFNMPAVFHWLVLASGCVFTMPSCMSHISDTMSCSMCIVHTLTHFSTNTTIDSDVCDCNEYVPLFFASQRLKLAQCKRNQRKTLKYGSSCSITNRSTQFEINWMEHKQNQHSDNFYLI